MDEKSAWGIFCQSGKVQDYINYIQTKKHKIL